MTWPKVKLGEACEMAFQRWCTLTCKAKDQAYGRRATMPG